MEPHNGEGLLSFSAYLVYCDLTSQQYVLFNKENPNKALGNSRNFKVKKLQSFETTRSQNVFHGKRKWPGLAMSFLCSMP
jgi:hypothetical protein